MTGFTIETDHAGFRKMAGEFFRLAETATFEQVENGYKALSLAWLGLPDSTAVQEVEQQAILTLAFKTRMEAELKNDRLLEETDRNEIL